jgi:predicted nucleic acid-binding protein
VVLPGRVLGVISDESDNRVLEAASEGAADYIVSGDDDLLELRSFQRITIMTPAEFIADVLDQ